MLIGTYLEEDPLKWVGMTLPDIEGALPVIISEEEIETSKIEPVCNRNKIHPDIVVEAGWICSHRKSCIRPHFQMYVASRHI